MKWIGLGGELLGLLMFWRAFAMCGRFRGIWKDAGRGSFRAECWRSMRVLFFQASKLSGMSYFERSLSLGCAGAGACAACALAWASPSLWGDLARAFGSGADWVAPAGVIAHTLGIKGPGGLWMVLLKASERLLLPSVAVLCGHGAIKCFCDALASGVPEAKPLAEALSKAEGLALSGREAKALEAALGKPGREPGPAGEKAAEASRPRSRSL